MSERGDWLWANYADFSSAVWYGPDHKPIGCSTGSSMGGHACGGTRGAFDGSKGVDLCDRVARNGAQISIATSRTGVIRFGISPCDTLALPRGGGGWYDCPGQVDQLGLSLSEDGESCELSARIEPGTFGMLTVEGCAKPAVLEIYRRMFVQEARSLEWTDRSQR
ncbi:MAG: hypothetical protein HY898_17810 [Deltaproteobacteria bacterium]|nr:hypothetical protein [Deltaproteobacteria bacterium]